MGDLSKNILYDKFLSIEGWAFRGRKLCESENIDLARKAAMRIKIDLTELLILLKVDIDD